MSTDQSQSGTGEETPAEDDDTAGVAVAVNEVVEELPDEAAAPPPSAPTPPAEPREPSALDGELDEARNAVFDAIAAWLCVTWEQPILRAIGTNAGRALDRAENFPALRAALCDLQSNARKTVEETVGPLLDPDVPVREQALISNIDATTLQLVGLIGPPLKAAGFDPLSGGLERSQDGYRLKAMGEHDAISAALLGYSKLNASLAAERAERADNERENARIEVERLWKATGEIS